MKDLTVLCNLNIPIYVLKDINKRIADWLISGGSINDDYVQKQITYGEKVEKYLKQKRTKNDDINKMSNL